MIVNEHDALGFAVILIIGFYIVVKRIDKLRESLTSSVVTAIEIIDVRRESRRKGLEAQKHIAF